MGYLNKTKHTKEIYNDWLETGSYHITAKKYNISRETVRRYVVLHKETKDNKNFSPHLMQELMNKFTEKELRAILKGSQVDRRFPSAEYNFKGKELKIGIISDTHIGSLYTDVNLIYKAFEVFTKEKVDFICHTGDVLEGMSHRAGHVYELSDIGYTAQLNKAKEIFAEWTSTPIYMIDGNHDRWFIKSNGAKAIKDLCDSQENLEFIGHDNGKIKLNNKTNIELWHGEDGSSYAHSYRIQKKVEAITGGKKPNILICGHVHKSIYIFDRHIHCISAGCIQSQTPYMASKRLPAHVGFWTAKIHFNDNGVLRFLPEFYPTYS